MTDIALLVFCCYIIFAAINPIVNKLSEKIPRTWASVIMLTVVTLAVIGVFIPIIALSVHEVKEFAAQLPSQINSIQTFLGKYTFNGQSLNDMLSMKNTWGSNTKIAGDIIEQSINLTLSLFGVMAVLVTMGIIIFFFTNDRNKIKSFSLKLFPERMRERASEVIDDLEIKVGGYVLAQMFSMIIIGIIVAIGLGLLRVDYAILLGFIAAVSDLIPIIGPIICGILILLAGASNGWVIGILAVLVLVIAQFIQNNWAKPYFFSKYMDLHPLVVILSFVIAAKFLGVIGVIIAPALAAVVVTLFNEIYVKNMNDESNKK